MANTMLFLGWKRSGVYGLAVDPGVAVARLTASVTLTLDERDGAGTHTATVPFLIMGPGDVDGLKPAAVTRRAPQPHAVDVETTLSVHAELADASLPWRYTPELAAGDELRPWIVLVVGTIDEIELLPDNEVRLAATATGDHDLLESARWAHVQVDLDTEVDAGTALPIKTEAELALLQSTNAIRERSRLVSPRQLTPNAEHIAVIVPAFNADGTDSWAGAQQVVVARYHHWRFRTGDQGDFRTLAAQLRALPAGEESGRAPVGYPRLNLAEKLEIRGAIGPVDGKDRALDAAVSADALALLTPVSDPRGRPIVGPPTYGADWKADPLATPWGLTVNQDPRHRGVAGLGTAAGIVEQDTITDAVVEQAGPVLHVAGRIRSLVTGLAAAGSLWRRRRPKDPMHRLQLYGPALAAIPTATGSALDAVSSGARPLPAGLFSSAARRILRGGTARGDLVKPGAMHPATVIPLANQCPPVVEPVALGPSVEAFAKQNGLHFPGGGPPDPAGVVKALIDALKRFGHDQRVQQLLQQLAAADPRRLSWVDMLSLMELADRQEDLTPGKVAGFLENLLNSASPGGLDLTDLAKETLATSKRDPCDPVDLLLLEKKLTAAFDPTGPNAWMRERVLATITGLQDPVLAPTEVCTSVDLPAWRILRDMAPDFLLPGVGSLEGNAVYAFESNPVFVEAFLLGLNHQALAELRWRNLPIVTGCTPLRRFWSRIDPTATTELDDMRGVHLWPDASEMAASTHHPPGAGGTQLVLVFKSEIFRRYPETVVAAVKAKLDAGEPSFTEANAPDGTQDKVWPVFQGSIGDDVTFFGFPLTPTQARAYWLVLEEPPAGLRFRSDLADPVVVADIPAVGLDTGGGYAVTRLNDPTRVLIRGPRLIPEL